MCLFVVLNLSSIMARDLLNLVGKNRSQINIWAAYCIFVNFIFLVELVLLAFARGIRYLFIRRKFTYVEIIFQGLNMWAFVSMVMGSSLRVPQKLLLLTMILRVLRIAKQFREIKRWKVIIDTISALLRPFWVLLLV